MLTVSEPGIYSTFYQINHDYGDTIGWPDTLEEIESENDYVTLPNGESPDDSTSAWYSTNYIADLCNAYPTGNETKESSEYTFNSTMHRMFYAASLEECDWLYCGKTVNRLTNWNVDSFSRIIEGTSTRIDLMNTLWGYENVFHNQAFKAEWTGYQSDLQYACQGTSWINGSQPQSAWGIPSNRYGTKSILVQNYGQNGNSVIVSQSVPKAVCQTDYSGESYENTYNASSSKSWIPWDSIYTADSGTVTDSNILYDETLLTAGTMTGATDIMLYDNQTIDLTES